MNLHTVLDADSTVQATADDAATATIALWEAERRHSTHPTAATLRAVDNARADLTIAVHDLVRAAVIATESTDAGAPGPSPLHSG